MLYPLRVSTKNHNASIDKDFFSNLTYLKAIFNNTLRFILGLPHSGEEEQNELKNTKSSLEMGIQEEETRRKSLGRRTQ